MPIPVKCLLVDDLDENLLALSALLDHVDVEVLKARSASEALELLLLHDVALAFLDVQMPELDGFQLAELMRGSERTRGIPIIFVTAGARDQHRMFKGYDSGAVDFLYKPIDANILRNKADVFFQLHRQKQQLAYELHERTETLRLNEIFTGVLGHDLRNPLHSILMSAEALHRSKDIEQVRKIAARVQTSGRRMHRMIEDMLDLTRIRLAGGMPLHHEPTDLGVLMQPVLQEHRASSPDRRIELMQYGDLSGSWDTDRLSQAASNLIGNAIQHGDPEGPVRIELDGTESAAVCLSITNLGSIPPELLPRIFEPFCGERRQASRSDGIGLGLFIVQQIVLAHGGRIDVESDESTRFRIVIPRRSASSAS